eukprot:403354308
MSSDQQIDPLTIVHIVFVTLESVSLGVFIYFVTKYTKQFRDSKDPYTIACFVFIIMAILTKISLKIYQFSPFGCGDTIQCRDVVYCSKQVSYYIPTGLLTVAILINVFRWLILIMQYNSKKKNNSICHTGGDLDEETQLKISFSNNKQTRNLQKERKLNLLLIIMCFISLTIIVFKLIYNCNVSLANQSYAIIENYMFLLLMFAINIFAVIIYIYAQRYFSKYYQKQIENNQDILDSEQLLDIKSSIKFLRIFMQSICVIVIVRLIIIILYDLSYSYTLFYFQPPELIIETILIYLTEIGLILMMSQSIKETTKTSKRSESFFQNTNTPYQMLTPDQKRRNLGDGLDMDISQGDILQEIEQNLLKITAFQQFDSQQSNKSNNFLSSPIASQSIAFLHKTETQSSVVINESETSPQDILQKLQNQQKQ